MVLGSTHHVCAYQRFDPLTLTPLSTETALRIEDLNRVLPLVGGRTVLDIGCNGGLVSALALRAGATSVLATDIDDNFVRESQTVLAQEPIRASVRRLSFEEHGPAERRDVVFFLEVYHWLIQQGLTPEHVADRLDQLAGEVLIVETPWDRSDPSVAASMREVDYELPPLLTALTLRGFDIELVGFASYFPADYRRGIFVAQRRQLQASPRPGRREFRKAIDPLSPLISGDRLNLVLRELIGLPMAVLLSPLGVLESEKTVLYPWLDVVESLDQNMRRTGAANQTFAVPVALASDLVILRSVRDVPIAVPWEAAAEASAAMLGALTCESCRDALVAHSPDFETVTACPTYVHGDLHLSNIVLTTSGLRVIDLDNLHSAPGYTDIVTFLFSMSGISGDDGRSQMMRQFWDACGYLSTLFGREIQLLDIAYATGLALHRVDHSGLPLPGLGPVLCNLVGSLRGDRELPHQHQFVQ